MLWYDSIKKVCMFTVRNMKFKYCRSLPATFWKNRLIFLLFHTKYRMRLWNAFWSQLRPNESKILDDGWWSFILNIHWIEMQCNVITAHKICIHVNRINFHWRNGMKICHLLPHDVFTDIESKVECRACEKGTTHTHWQKTY